MAPDRPGRAASGTDVRPPTGDGLFGRSGGESAACCSVSRFTAAGACTAALGPVAALVLLGLGAAVWTARDRIAELGARRPGLGADTAARMGALEVTSAPAGAQVIIGGTSYGVTPLTIPELPAGSHTVRLDSEAGSIERVVQIEAGLTGHSTNRFFRAGWRSLRRCSWTSSMAGAGSPRPRTAA